MSFYEIPDQLVQFMNQHSLKTGEYLHIHSINLTQSKNIQPVLTLIDPIRLIPIFKVNFNVFNDSHLLNKPVTIIDTLDGDEAFLIEHTIHQIPKILRQEQRFSVVNITTLDNESNKIQNIVTDEIILVTAYECNIIILKFFKFHSDMAISRILKDENKYC